MAELRVLAEREGSQVHDVVDEALRDLIAKRKGGMPRDEVLVAFGESLVEYEDLYRELTKR